MTKSTAMTARPARAASGRRHIAAAHMASHIYAEALNTPAPAQTLDNVLNALPQVLPAVFRTMDTPTALGKALLPEVAHRVRALRNIEQARPGWPGNLGEVLDVMVEAIRRGSDPEAVTNCVLGLLQRARAEGKTLVSLALTDGTVGGVR